MTTKRTAAWIFFVLLSALPVLIEGLYLRHMLVNGKPYKETLFNGAPAFERLALATVALVPMLSVVVAIIVSRSWMVVAPLIAAAVAPVLMLMCFWLLVPSPAKLPTIVVPTQSDVVIKTPRMKLDEARSEFVSDAVMAGGVGIVFAAIAVLVLRTARTRDVIPA
jgi:hypothetical protein